MERYASYEDAFAVQPASVREEYAAAWGRRAAEQWAIDNGRRLSTDPDKTSGSVGAAAGTGVQCGTDGADGVAATASTEGGLRAARRDDGVVLVHLWDAEPEKAAFRLGFA